MTWPLKKVKRKNKNEYFYINVYTGEEYRTKKTMMNNPTFSFTTQNPKASRYLLICLISFMLIFCSSFLNPVVLIILIFGCMVLGFILFARHSKISEEITLYDTYFHSRVFGSISYEDIVSAKPVTVDTGEGLKLKLTNGKKVWWKYLIKSEKEEYDSFLSALSTAVDHLNLSQNKDALSESKPEIEASRLSIAAQESEPDEGGTSLGQELKHVQKKNKNSGNARTFLLVLSGVVLALYGLIQTCGSEWVHERNEKEMAPIRQAVMDNLDEKATLEDSARIVMHAFAKEHGPYYLFTNDTGAAIAYLPRLNIQRSKTHITSLVDNNDVTDKLKSFLKHPDSATWDMAMMNGFTSFRFGNGLFDSDDRSKTIIFWGAVDTTFQIASPGAYNDNHPDSVAFQSSFATVIDMKLDFEGQILTGMQRYMRLFSKHPHTMKFYVAVRGTQMDKAHFDKAVKTIKEELKYFGADTSKFETKTFGQQ